MKFNKKAFSLEVSLFVFSLLIYIAIVIIFYLILGFDKAHIETRITETTAELNDAAFLLSYLRTPAGDNSIIDLVAAGNKKLLSMETDNILHKLYSKKMCWELKAGEFELESDCINPVILDKIPLEETIILPLPYHPDNKKTELKISVKGYDNVQT